MSIVPYKTIVQSVQSAQLKAFWPLTETSGTVADNILGDATLDAAYSGVTLNQFVGPKGEPAGLWDGSNDYVDLYTAALATALADAFTAGAISISIWFRPFDSRAYHINASEVGLINLGASTSVQVGVRRPITFGTLQHYYRTTTQKQVTSSGYDGSVVWHHLVITVTDLGDQMKAYIDGVQVGSTQTGIGTWSGALAATLCTIGSLNTTPTGCFHGYFAYPAVWSTTLSLAEVLQLWDGGPDEASELLVAEENWLTNGKFGGDDGPDFSGWGDTGGLWEEALHGQLNTNCTPSFSPRTCYLQMDTSDPGKPPRLWDTLPSSDTVTQDFIPTNVHDTLYLRHEEGGHMGGTSTIRMRISGRAVAGTGAWTQIWERYGVEHVWGTKCPVIRLERNIELPSGSYGEYRLEVYGQLTNTEEAVILGDLFIGGVLVSDPPDPDPDPPPPPPPPDPDPEPPAPSVSGYTLFDIVRRVAQELGDTKVGRVTSGTVSQVVDTVGLANYSANYFKGCGFFLLHDAAGTNLAPEHECDAIVASTSESVDLQNGLSTPVGAGDRYMISSRRYPLYNMIEAINSSLRWLGPIPRQDTTLTTSASTTEYTLPLGVRDLFEVYHASNSGAEGDYGWIKMYGWKIQRNQPTLTDSLILPYPPPSNSTIKLVYMAEHADVFHCSDTISNIIEPRALVAMAVYLLIRDRLRGANDADPKLSKQLEQAAAEYERFSAGAVMFKPNRTPDIFTLGGGVGRPSSGY